MHIGSLEIAFMQALDAAHEGLQEHQERAGRANHGNRSDDETCPQVLQFTHLLP